MNATITIRKMVAGTLLLVSCNLYGESDPLSVVTQKFQRSEARIEERIASEKYENMETYRRGLEQALAKHKSTGELDEYLA